MELRRLGKTDMEVSILGFGGAEIGLESPGASLETVTRLLNAALDEGLNLIDTGECYGSSEELIGRSVSGRRQDYYLFTKCGHPNGLPGEDWRQDSLLRSIQRSLRRLRTDCLDLVQLHSCSEDALLEGTVIEALQRARERGYCRYIGYSGDSRAAYYAAQCQAFDCLQISISIADQEALDLALPLAHEQHLGVIAKRPLANAAWRTGRQPANSYHHTYWDRLQRLNYPFVKDELETSISTALRFTLSAPGVHTAIVGTLTPGRWRQNAALLEAGPLPSSQFDAIRKRWSEVAEASWFGQT
ncbi:MAG: aldo/keto reductase [Acidobacteriota bacterium]|nr:aldo/keto reductase [Acidobacteriota bacterium]